MKLMRNRTFNRLMRDRHREGELQGHKTAFAAFEFGDKVIVGPCVVRDSNITEKLVILGNDAIIAHCVFHNDSGEGTLLDMC